MKTKFPPNTSLEDAYLICAGTILNEQNLVRTNLQDAVLCYSELINIKLAYANLIKANLKGAILNGANLKYANLKNANLNYVNLKNANLERTNLVNANLQGAILENTNLRFCDLRGANLKDTNLTGTSLKEIIYNNQSVFPNGINLNEAYFSRKNTNYLAQLNSPVIKDKSPLIEALKRIQFEGEFYPGLTREEIDEITKDLPFTFPEELYELYEWHNGMKEPRGWDQCFVSSKEFIRLQEAIQYTEALATSEYRSEYIKPNWFYAFAEGTDNSYAYVLVLGEEVATVLDFCPDSYSVSVAYSSITQMMLAKAFGQQVDFSGANLAGVDLSGFNLRCSKLSLTNLSGANLSHTNLEEADLRGACLHNANFKGSIIKNADFTDVFFCQTIMPDGSIRNSEFA